MTNDERTNKTINIPTRLHRELKAHAALEGKSLQELVVATLAAALGLEGEDD